MGESTPHLAPLAVLFFLSAIALAGLSLLVWLYGAFHHLAKVALLGAIGVPSVLAGYLVLLIGVSLASHETTLAPGGWKYFCEMDCHIGYSIAAARSATAIGPEMQPVTASGEFVFVEMKVWFDEHTISRTRGDGPLTPNPRRVVLVDARGHSYEESAKAEAEFAREQGPQPSLSQPLRPRESFRKALIFDVPQNAQGLRLLITEDDPESHLLIGHENSFLHKKIYLGLPPAGDITPALSKLAAQN